MKAGPPYPQVTDKILPVTILFFYKRRHLNLKKPLTHFLVKAATERGRNSNRIVATHKENLPSHPYS
jgi:hypothetical protein